MDSVIGGLMLILVGFFTGLITYKRYTLFWDSISTKLLRRYLGDAVTSIVLYAIGLVLVIVGVLLAVGVVR